MFANGGKAPKVSATHTVAVYDRRDGKVVHMHHVVVFEGGKKVNEQEAENEALQKPVKLFWMSLSHDWRAEPDPTLTVTGKRLDGPAPPVLAMPAVNAFPGPAPAMIVGVYVPTPGCWEITGEYKGEKLSFVVWVEKQGGPEGPPS